jgi:hypothetical protein
LRRRSRLGAVVAGLACVFLAGAVCAQAPVASERVAAARALVAAAGTSETFNNVLPLLTNQLRPSFLALAPDKAGEINDVLDKLMERFKARSAEVIEEIARIYAAEFSIEDMEAITAFYRTPAGRKLVAKLPVIAQRSMVIGQRWGMQLGREIEAEAKRELKKRGIDL